MMKKIGVLVALVLITSSISFAQFKDQLSDQPSVQSSLIRSEDSNFLLGFFNPANFSMRQSVSMSYTTFGNQGIALGMYTNSMSYKISNPLTLSADVSILNSPYSSLGSKFSQGLNGIYLTRADLNYHPTDNFQVDLQFNQNPLYRYYNPYYYYNPWGW
jgi:maltoporin